MHITSVRTICLIVLLWLSHADSGLKTDSRREAPHEPYAAPAEVATIDDWGVGGHYWYRWLGNGDLLYFNSDGRVFKRTMISRIEAPVDWLPHFVMSSPPDGPDYYVGTVGIPYAFEWLEVSPDGRAAVWSPDSHNVVFSNALGHNSTVRHKVYQKSAGTDNNACYTISVRPDHSVTEITVNDWSGRRYSMRMPVAGPSYLGRIVASHSVDETGARSLIVYVPEFPPLRVMIFANSRINRRTVIERHVRFPDDWSMSGDGSASPSPDGHRVLWMLQHNTREGVDAYAIWISDANALNMHEVCTLAVPNVKNSNDLPSNLQWQSDSVHASFTNAKRLWLVAL